MNIFLAQEERGAELILIQVSESSTFSFADIHNHAHTTMISQILPAFELRSFFRHRHDDTRRMLFKNELQSHFA
jgi:hypothetical protein